MKYTIKIERKAAKFIQKQPANQQRRIYAAIQKLPDLGDIKQMQGAEGLFRLRIGDYRILYTIDHGELIIYVIDANNRGDVYKRY